MSILERLADPMEIANMTMDERLLATLYVAILGMGITFLVLIFLQYCIKFMSLLLNAGVQKSAVGVKEANVSLERPVPEDWVQEADEEELVAVIAAAAAAFMGCSTDRIIVRNVRRLQEGAPNWAKAGLMEQMRMRKSF